MDAAVRKEASVKTRLSVMPAFGALAFIGVLAAGGATPAHAGPYTDELSKCLVDHTTEQDKAALVRWIFASTAQHPAVAELAQVTPEQRTEMSKTVAGLFERLLTQDCRAPFRDARKNEGQETVSAGFGVLVQTAMRGLIENATVSSALASVDAHLDKQKIAAAMADSP